MAEELSAATSYTEDDFYCPVCQEVLKTPVWTVACQHVFCRKCFLIAVRESGIHCPLCHGSIVPMTCPICVSLPWGDPSQVTRNFVSHVNQRHPFDYGEFVNLQLDEETPYQTAVEESFQVNI
ncbi:unnamed protein product [Rangifer tarandus platyrhynchus]|uniref:E3 ubiquitin-protein ligase RNF138 n=1 Tax=Rangifer tarandus platyrhynchus TaxID=3082113 RepID=A0ABN8XMY4_RANTA|nr:unnamed protein product [Rangifer tarandus platyrhynchus]